MKRALVLLALLGGASACTNTPVTNDETSADNPVTLREPASYSANMTDARMQKLLNVALYTDRKDVVTLNATEYQYQSTGTQTVTLDNCKGSASLNRVNGTLELVVNSPLSCSNVFADDPQTHQPKFIGHIEDGIGQQKISLSEAYGDNVFHVYLTSQSGKTAANIQIHSFVQRPKHNFDFQVSDFDLSTYTFGRRWGQLADCGGSALMGIDDQKQVYVTFFGLQNCSKFSILNSNGSPTSQVDTPIGMLDTGRGGTIYIPRELYQSGANSIKVVVKSDSEKTYDIFRIDFPAH